MKVMLINGRKVPYPELICLQQKTIETRRKNMLRRLVGERVAIAETGGRNGPVIIGYADVIGSFFCSSADFDKYREQTMIPPGDEYDCKGPGKWFYQLANAEFCTPYPLPSSAIRHGRSWAEF